MDLVAAFCDAVKAPQRGGVFAGDVVTVVGERFTRCQARSFADDFVAFDHHAMAVRMFDHPLATQQRDRLVRAVVDGDEVDKRVGLVRGQTATPMMVDQLVEAGTEPGKENGGSHRRE